jgi:peptidoglycan LD-endopeptidase LytH
MRNPLDYMEIRRGLPNHGFGRVRNNGTRAHQGWDLWAPVGTPIYAVANGVVEFVRLDSGDYGSQICASFENPNSPGSLLYAFYAHLSQIYVTEKAVVEEGQVLGLTGNTGNASTLSSFEDEHLHFELRTSVAPGLGLSDRLDPAEFFGYDLYATSPSLPTCRAGL